MFSRLIHGATSSTPTTIYQEGRLLLQPPLSQQADYNRSSLGVASVDNQKLVQAIADTREHETARKSASQARADAAWAAWNNEHNFGDKAQWQEQTRIPKAWIHTERAVSTFMQFITVVPQWFDIESVLPSQEFAINLIKNLIKNDLEDDRVGFWPLVEDTFRELYITGNAETFVGYERGKLAILESDTNPDIDPDDDDEDLSKHDIDFSLYGKDLDSIGRGMGLLSEQSDPMSGDKILLPSNNVPRLRLERIPFERVWRDSSGQKRYIMWTTYSNVGDFRHQAEIRGWDPDAVERAIQGNATWSATASSNTTRATNQGMYGGTTQDDIDFAVEITHFQGVLYDRSNKGEILFRNKYVAVANGELLFEPMEPPFWDGEFPLVSSKIARNPNSVYGKSIVAENVEIFDLQISLMLQLADALQRELDPAYEYDASQMPDKNPVNQPLGPGVMYKTVKNGANTPAINKIAAGNFDGNVANAFQLLNTLLDGMSGATQDGGAAPRSRNRMSGQETAVREQQREGLNTFFFGNIDKEFLTPLLRLTLLRSLQFRDDKEWKLWVLANKAKLVPDGPPDVRAKWLEEFNAASKWNARERYKNLGAFFRFKVKIAGNALHRQMAMERVTSLLNVVRQSPEMLQRLNIQYIMGQLVECLGWDPEEAINAESNVRPEGSADALLDMDENPFGVADSGLGGMAPGNSLGGMPTMPPTGPPPAPM